MNLKEMNLGYFGILEREVGELQNIFQSVELLRFPLRKKYDLYYIDLSFISSRILNYIRNEDSIPLIVKNRFEHPREKLAFLHEDAYLCLETGRDYLMEEFTDLVKSYLERFKEKQMDYQLFKAEADVKTYMKSEIQKERINQSIFRAEEYYCSKPRAVEFEIRNTRDVWEKWKSRYDCIFID